MSENVQQEQITQADALRYRASLRGNRKCSACGENRFEAIVQPAGDGPVLVAQMHMTTRGMGFFPTVAFICTDCGNVSQYSWEGVWNWVQENPSETEN